MTIESLPNNISVTVGEFVATGCGQSKKKAKHSAAKSILDKLIGAQNSGKAPAGQPTIPDLATEVLSPYDDGIQGQTSLKVISA